MRAFIKLTPVFYPNSSLFVDIDKIVVVGLAPASNGFDRTQLLIEVEGSVPTTRFVTETPDEVMQQIAQINAELSQNKTI